MARAADARLAALVPGQRVPAVGALAAEHLQQGDRLTSCSAAAVSCRAGNESSRRIKLRARWLAQILKATRPF